MIAFKEIDILDEKFRANVIEEINSRENTDRKVKQFRRYEVYNDMVAKYTEDLFAKQFDKATINEMKMSLTNVSLCKKIINKIARVYSHGVVRDLGENKKRLQKGFDKLQSHLKINSKMKKSNRYLELHKNIKIMALPYPVKDFSGEVIAYDLKICVLPPFLFDVIEDSDNREKSVCTILSNFDQGLNQIMYDAPERTGSRGLQSQGVNSFYSGNRKDEVIADTPNDFDPKKQKYIWWSDNYHFSTDVSGVIISDGDGKNPIGMYPGIDLNKDQDGEYYSIGGDDLVDSCILANAMMTNINHIGVQQGYGQAYMIGKNLPQKVRLGPTQCVKLEPSSEGESPSFGFATSSPPLTELKELTITQIALLLSTNNLSTKGVKVNLDSGMDFPSGVAAMIDQSETTEDVKDQAQLYLDNEPKMWEVIAAWIELYKSKGVLTEELSDVEFNPDDLVIQINEPKFIQSESEKLDNLKKRKELGLNTLIELLMIDNPGMAKVDAEAKLLVIKEEAEQAVTDAQDNMGLSVNDKLSIDNKSQPMGEVEKVGKYYEDDAGNLWEKTLDGFKRVKEAQATQ